MYTIYADDQLLFSTSSPKAVRGILNPQLSFDVNGAGSLTFTLLPGHEKYDSIRKLKTTILVRQDGKAIFRGRVMDDERDFYNQREIYCEGDRSFLLDSQCPPYTYKGTVHGLFKKLVKAHNEQVGEDRQFTAGNITITDEDETVEAENIAYWETLKEMEEKLLGAYGGYLMTRTEGGKTYLDWLETPGRTDAQSIKFAVNLLDLKDKVDAADVFTVLIPLGATVIGDDGEAKEPVTIESENSGKNYLEDEAAIALYGRICRTKTWNYVEDPAELRKKGLEYLKTGIALQTLTLKAIDMHFIDGDAEAIRVGDHVRIISDPHGLDISIICTKIDIDMLNPENTTYTFGEPPRTLTENIVKTEEEVETMTGGGGGGGGSVKKEGEDGIVRWANLNVSVEQSRIDMVAGVSREHGRIFNESGIIIDGDIGNVQVVATNKQHQELKNILTEAGINVSGKGEVTIVATKKETDELTGRLDEAESQITANTEGISLKVSKNGVISAINQTAESIKIQASKINLEGYVTTEMLASDAITLRTLNVTGATTTNSLNVSKLASVGSLKVDSYNISLERATFLTSSTTLTVNATGGTVTGVTLNKKTDTIYYMAWA